MPEQDPLAEARKRVEAAEVAKRKAKERSAGSPAPSPSPGFGEQLGAAWRWLRGPKREEPQRAEPKRDTGKRR